MPPLERSAPPPLLLGGALLFWGWQTGMWPFAVAMAAILEAARWVRWRWEVSDREFNRLADASAVIFLVVVVYQFEEHSFQGVYAILALLPFVLFALTAAQLYSTRERIKLSALFLGIRRAEARREIGDPGSVDITWPFFVVCLVAASADPGGAPGFYAGLCALVAWALWWWRPARYPAWAWAALFATATAGGFVAQVALVELRAAMEPLVMEWFHDRLWRHRDPFRAQTRIGHIGRLKTSERIVMRIRPEEGAPVPGLLREASYRTFSRNVWLAGDTTFADVQPNDAGVTWRLDEPAGVSGSARISTYLDRGRGLLAVPNGTYEIDDLLVDQMQQNPLGAIKVREGPDLIEYRARYASGASRDRPPGKSDRLVPPRYRELLAGIAAELGLGDVPPREVLNRVARYFERNFRYSLVQSPRAAYTPLHEFLRSTRAGHCEYFATATTLLLRVAGLPARYATGYGVDEYSALEQQYIVRRRHAHSWTLVYLDGRWQNFDTTPAVWRGLEAEGAPWWQPVYDALSWSLYRYKRWRLQEDSAEGWRAWLLWLVLPLALLLAWRLRARKRVERYPGGIGPGSARAEGGRGLDSELFLLERRLVASGLERRRGETLARWVERHARSGRLAGASEIRDAMLPVHYRCRFDPAGVSASERRALRARVQAWLALHALEQ